MINKFFYLLFSLFLCFLVNPLLLYSENTSVQTAVQTNVIGLTTRGRPIILYKMGTGSETVMYFGSFHGDEPQGRDLLFRLMDYLTVHPELLSNKTALFIPAVNPDGLALKKRTNARGVDINRNFPTPDWSRRYTRKDYYPGTRNPERETKAIMRQFKKYKPQAIITLHAYLRCNNFDGPGEILANEMAKYNHFPVRPYIGYKTPGSFGSYAGKTKKIPIVTLELSRSATEEAWLEQKEALMVLLKLNSFSQSIPDNSNYLFEACENNDIQAVKNILAQGFPVNQRDNTGRTALMIACNSGWTDIASCLIDNNADVNASDNTGWTPLMQAAQKGNTNIVSLLIKNGAQINAIDKHRRTALLEAAKNGNIDTVRLLIASGANIKIKDNEGKTALVDTCRLGYFNTMKTLIESGADVNEKDTAGRTPLMEAVHYDNPSMVKYLLKYGVDIDAKDINGKTALKEAVSDGNRTLIRMIKKYASIKYAGEQKINQIETRQTGK
jgi:ankyrin repeat protein